MSRKKQRRYKLLQPEPSIEPIPPRVQAVVTVILWMFYGALAGVLVAFGLILTLYAHWRVPTQVWLRLWPASFQLMTATEAANRHLAWMALWTTLQNGLMYGAAGIVLGAAYAWMRARRERRRKQHA